MAMVMGPTPPGFGVMAPAFGCFLQIDLWVGWACPSSRECLWMLGWCWWAGCCSEVRWMWGFYFSSMLEDSSCFLFYFIRADFLFFLLASIRADSAVCRLCPSSRELSCLCSIALALKQAPSFPISALAIGAAVMICFSSMEASAWKCSQAAACW